MLTFNFKSTVDDSCVSVNIHDESSLAKAYEIAKLKAEAKLGVPVVNVPRKELTDNLLIL